MNGIPDLAVLSATNTDLTILQGTGHGNFAPAVSWAAGTTPIGLVAGNFNGDALPDPAHHLTRRSVARNQLPIC